MGFLRVGLRSAGCQPAGLGGASRRQQAGSLRYADPRMSDTNPLNNKLQAGSPCHGNLLPRREQIRDDVFERDVFYRYVRHAAGGQDFLRDGYDVRRVYA